MSWTSSAARTNLSSQQVYISNDVLGQGVFRTAFEGTYIGGNRNQQEAACKRFKSKYRHLEDEFFSNDFRIAERAIAVAEEWNEICPNGKEIMITKGDVKTSRDGTKYLVEPLIRYYTSFTSNSGWIASVDDEGWKVLAMEAFSHYSYHRSGGSMIICDLQGRYRHDKYVSRRRRSELTDPAICSRRRLYGPTDLGEKGIESFFYNHRCNKFCNVDERWQRPRNVSSWFASSSSTAMFSSRDSHLLRLGNGTTFRLGLGNIMEADSFSF